MGMPHYGIASRKRNGDRRGGKGLELLPVWLVKMAKARILLAFGAAVLEMLTSIYRQLVPDGQPSSG